MRVLWFVALSNHIHYAIFDEHGRHPEFTEHFHKMLARVLNLPPCCVTTSPPVGFDGALPGGSASMTLSACTVSPPAIVSFSPVGLALLELAAMTYGTGTGPAGGVGGLLLTSGPATTL
jgi:hypothetical protein